MIKSDEGKTLVYGEGYKVMSEFMSVCTVILEKVDKKVLIDAVNMAEKVVELEKQGIDVDNLTDDDFVKAMDAVLSVTRGDYDA